MKLLTNFFLCMSMIIITSMLVPVAHATTSFIQTTIAPKSYYYWTVYSNCEYFSMTSYCSPYSCNLLVFSAANFLLYQRDTNKTGIPTVYRSTNTPTYTYSASSEIIAKHKGIIIVLENPNVMNGLRAELNIQEQYSYANIIGTITAILAPSVCCLCICCLCCCVTCFICCSKKKTASNFGRSSTAYTSLPYNYSANNSSSSTPYQPAFIVQKPTSPYAYPQNSQLQLIQQQPVISLLPSANSNNGMSLQANATTQMYQQSQQSPRYYTPQQTQPQQPSMYYQQSAAAMEHPPVYEPSAPLMTDSSAPPTNPQYHV